MEESKGKRKTTTSTAVKARYNAKSYEQVKFQVRKDSPLMEQINAFKENNPNKFSELIRDLLEEYFEKK